KTILASAENKPQPTGVRAGQPAPTSAATAQARQTTTKSSQASKRGLLMGAGLLAVGLVLVVLLACAASVFFIGSRNPKASADLLAIEATIRMEQEAAQRRAEEEKRDVEKKLAEQEKRDIEKKLAEQEKRELEKKLTQQEKRDSEKKLADAAEAKRRLEQEKL